MMRPWTRWHSLAAIAAAAGVLALAILVGSRAVDKRAPRFAPVSFSDIGGWEGDDHAAAFAAFARSCRKIVQVAGARAAAGKDDPQPNPFTRACRAAIALGGGATGEQAREFFEAQFTPHRIGGETAGGLVTGYYEPEVNGARSRSRRYAVPVYRVPDDLVQLFPDAERAKRNDEMTAGRKAGGEIVPYHDRKEIEQGALAGRGLEILWLEDPVDAFYMHIQGSGRVALEGGGHVRLAYAAKNGHPYTAIGRVLIERGDVEPEKMSMQAVRNWLAANPDAGRELMWQNRSYIFFRELPGDGETEGPEGAQGVPLTPGRSLAVDTSIHAAGTPVWVDAPELRAQGKGGFSRLMIAQDTGSAIRGPERGDIFFGSGEAAGALAGATRHPARFTVLLPKGAIPGS